MKKPTFSAIQIFLVLDGGICCAKNHILFFQLYWKDGLSKQIALGYISCAIRKDDISFSRKYDLIFSTKNEIWSSQKKDNGNVIFSSNVLKRYSFQKITLEYDLSCIIRKDGISFSRKCDIFSRWKVKDDISQKIHGNMMFPVYYSVKVVFFFLQAWN